MHTPKRLLMSMLVFSPMQSPLFAQESTAPENSKATLISIITDGGLFSIIVWAMLLGVSFIAFVLLLRCFQLLSHKNFFNKKDLYSTAYLSDKSLHKTIAGEMQKSGTVFAVTIFTILSNLRKGEEKVESIAANVIQQEISAISRTISSLQMCGNIAPMLGLLGTVTGMVSAFMGLGTTLGAEKASVLAISISQALYTTAAGLLVAVPALAFAHIAQNMLDKRIQKVVNKVELATAKLWK